MARARPDEQRVRHMRHEVEAALRLHPWLGMLEGSLSWNDLPHAISARVVNAELVQLNANHRYSVDEWLWWIGHARLHIALGHPWDVRRSYENPIPFAIARCLLVNDLLFQLGVGKPPTRDGRPLTREPLPDRQVDHLVEHLQRSIPEHWHDCGGVSGESDIIGVPPIIAENAVANPWRTFHTREHCAAVFAKAMRQALTDSIDRAGGTLATDTEGKVVRGPAMLAARWIRSHLPMIGALLDRYQIIEDREICRRMDIQVAAICDGTQEIYLNPACLNDVAEYTFVLAHELLHAGLRHGDRCGGRDPEYWNAACDFVINGWLVEMGVGRPPAIGGLHDPTLAGRSADQVYDQIHATLDRKELTGFAAHGDLRQRSHGTNTDWADLDSWCRNVLLNGLELHQAQRGTLPAGLIEAVRALAQPPIAWDVELARWFEREIGLTPLRRSYARSSRRQMATPDIPRPRWVSQDDDADQPTFATIIDTSGSMDRGLLGKALGAVASYAQAREVRRVRMIWCDAAAYDAGWIAPEQLLERIEVRGRGGTVMQAGIDLLERADDFPKQGPILIITDGWCDRFICRRVHALLIPVGARLPFIPKGEVFRMT
jgi:predicted metal-dependent peptidase